MPHARPRLTGRRPRRDLPRHADSAGEVNAPGAGALRRRAAWQIGLALPSGAGEWRAAFSRLDDRGPAPQADRKLLALSYRHKLSRRTLLYATVAHDQARSQPGRKGIELGLRHSF